MVKKQALLIAGILMAVAMTASAARLARDVPQIIIVGTNLSPRPASVSAPVLSGISPNPNTVGNVALSWSSVFQADYYCIYVSVSPITNVSGMFPVAMTWGTTYTDFEVNGTYYYAVTAVSGSEESSPSNCQSVTIAAVAPTSAPVLSGISPNPSGSPVSLSWSAVSNAAGYRVYKNTTPSFDTSMPVRTVQSTSCQVDIYANGTYYFAVSAYNGGGMSALSGSQSVMIILYAPPAPVLSVITPNPNTLGNITLSWSVVSGAYYYVVYESTSPISDSNITNYQYDENMYVFDITFTDLRSNGTYYYAVTAVNGTGRSVASNCQSVVVTVQTVGNTFLSGISPNPNTSGNIALLWTAASNAVGYYVFRNTTPVFDISYPVDEVPAPQTTYNDTVEYNGTYYYAVAAYNGAGMSALSSSQSVVVVLNPIPMNTYIGVSPGNSFQYNATLYGTGCPPGMSAGTYAMVMVVDNTTDNGRNATIGFHIVFSNATDSSLFVYYSIMGIRATHTGPEWEPWFINKNTANKSIDTGLQVFGLYSYWMNATWDNAGVLTTLSQWVSYEGAVSSMVITRVTTSPPPPPPPPPTTPDGIPGYPVIVLAGFALVTIMALASRKKRMWRSNRINGETLL